MAATISAWDPSLNLTSPDGQNKAVMDDGHEFGQGSPTIGTLVLSNGLTFEGCSPSAVWSDDSKFLAVPQWIRTQGQRILVISIERQSFGYTADIYSVLELHSFSAGTIKGIDSPAYEPRDIEVDVSKIRWPDPNTDSFWRRLKDIIGLS